MIETIKVSESRSGKPKFFIFGLRLNAFIHAMKARHTFVELETVFQKANWEARTKTPIPVNTMRAHMHCHCKVKKVPSFTPEIEKVIRQMISDVPTEAVKRERTKRAKRVRRGLLLGPNDGRRKEPKKAKRSTAGSKIIKKIVAKRSRKSSRPNVQPNR